jgi:hypothetical protein
MFVMTVFLDLNYTKLIFQNQILSPKF